MTWKKFPYPETFPWCKHHNDKCIHVFLEKAKDDLYRCVCSCSTWSGKGKMCHGYEIRLKMKNAPLPGEMCVEFDCQHPGMTARIPQYEGSSYFACSRCRKVFIEVVDDEDFV